MVNYTSVIRLGGRLKKLKTSALRKTLPKERRSIIQADLFLLVCDWQ